MSIPLEEKKKKARSWFKSLRDQICSNFEKIEDDYGNQEGASATFKRQEWQRDGGGGGVISLMKGQVFEKVGVNISTVFGEFSQEIRSEIPGAVRDPRFWASGISIVAHLCSPLVPAVHMNTRMIITQKQWFGGGMDLTPMYPKDMDTQFFHRGLKETCDHYDPGYYPRFKKWADEYFYLPHRQESRGIGGIFFDNLHTKNWAKDFSFTQHVGKTLLKVYEPLVREHMYEVWTPEQRDYQLEKRGRYVEFNLMYDRGTQFGFKTKGNPEAILMSLPPQVTWS